jgi:photoactive yellow protein
MQFVSFDADDLDNVFANSTAEELDQVPFGIVKVNRDGRILLFNTVEAQITGHTAGDVVDKNFFTDVAPCTNEGSFRGRFDEGVKKGNLNVVFEWHLDGKDMPMVQVHMKAARTADTYWIFTKRL